MAEQNKKIIKFDAFTVPKGNSRGIEYSKEAMNYLLQNRYFTIEILNVDLKGGINPIERRINIFKI